MKRKILQRLSLTAIFSSIVLASMFLGIVPVQDWLDQQDKRDQLKAELEEIQDKNNSYAVEIEALKTDEEIERLARVQYNLIKPFEEAYYVVQSPESDLKIPEVWPFVKG